MGAVRVEARGLDETIAALKGVQRELQKEQRAAFREVGQEVAAWLTEGARAGTPAERRFAGAFRGRSTQKFARIAVSSTGGNAGAFPTFFGTKKNTGWYDGWYDGRRDPQRAAGFYSQPRQRQHPEWIGASWRLGVPGEGPYVVRRVIPARMDAIADMLADAQQRALRKVFPEGGPS